MKVPVNEPIVSKEAIQNVEKALESGWLSSSGPFVAEFEDTFAHYIGSKHAITVSSGTAALHLSLLAYNIGPDDEVIVPAFSMGAVWMSVLQTGAKPIFVDCEPETFNINPGKIEEKITKKTKVIIVVHTYGHPADMDTITPIARKHALTIIEDAAEAHGSKYKGKQCGSLSDIAAFSFYANKLITTGEGGMVVTNNEKIAEKVRKLKDLSHSPEKRFIHDGIGFNYRMTNLQSAVGLGELSHVEEYFEKKRTVAAKYSKALSKIPGIQVPIEKSWAKSNFWMYTILVDKEKFGMDKDELRTTLSSRGIDTRDFFYPPHAHPALKDVVEKNESFPVAERIAQEGLYLPSGLALTDKQVEYVIAQITDIHK